MSEKNPYDPTQAQLGYLKELDSEKLQLEDLCNPTAVLLLVQQRNVALVKVQDLKQQVAELQGNNANLTGHLGDFRVRLAQSRERDLVSWIEIPVGALLGYGFSLLSTDLGLGLSLIILSAVILLFLRWSYFSPLIKQIKLKGKDNA